MSTTTSNLGLIICNIHITMAHGPVAHLKSNSNVETFNFQHFFNEFPAYHGNFNLSIIFIIDLGADDQAQQSMPIYIKCMYDLILNAKHFFFDKNVPDHFSLPSSRNFHTWIKCETYFKSISNFYLGTYLHIYCLLAFLYFYQGYDH